MAYACDICNKGKQFGHNVPFSQHKTNKVWKPNLQRQRVSLGSNRIQVKICTSCIRTLAKYEREALAEAAAKQEVMVADGATVETRKPVAARKPKPAAKAKTVAKVEASA